MGTRQSCQGGLIFKALQIMVTCATYPLNPAAVGKRCFWSKPSLNSNQELTQLKLLEGLPAQIPGTTHFQH
jgi:hypothetical protein